MTKTYTLYIAAYSPETIPLARLAKYMQSFAAMLGHETAVHFDQLDGGSTQLVTRIEHEDVPKVRARGRGGGQPQGPGGNRPAPGRGQRNRVYL